MSADLVPFYYSDQSAHGNAAGFISHERADQIIAQSLGSWDEKRRHIVLKCREGMLFPQAESRESVRLEKVCIGKARRGSFDTWEANAYPGGMKQMKEKSKASGFPRYRVTA